MRLGADDELCCLLVMVGARIDGTKELIALQAGYRESCESWARLLRDLKKRGRRAPVLAIGDGALGFWRACAKADIEETWIVDLPNKGIERHTDPPDDGYGRMERVGHGRPLTSEVRSDFLLLAEALIG